MLDRIKICNYKNFIDLDLTVNNSVNVMVGNNGTGKSTILEAIHLALTGYIRNRSIFNELTPYLFNIDVNREFIENAKKHREEVIDKIVPPEISIELYFVDTDDQELNKFRGSENSNITDSLGCSFKIKFDEKYQDEFKEYLKNEELGFIPTEFYHVEWKTFSGHIITPRSIPFKSYFLDSRDSTFSQLPQKHFMKIIDNTLDNKQRAQLSVLYREYKEQFAKHNEVQKLNKSLNDLKKGSFDNDDTQELSLSLDISQKTSWETAINAYIDNIPFDNIGTGNQNMLKSVYALQNRKEKQTILLMEEPENHLSFSNMRKLLSRMLELSEGQQTFVSTHSSYILNKLHMDKIIMLSQTDTTIMKRLPIDTVKYFQKLPNYNTLRYILSKKVILVEGPADELIVTKCYARINNGKV